MESFYRKIKRELVQDAGFEALEQAEKKFKNILNYITPQREYIPLSIACVNCLCHHLHFLILVE